MNLRNILVPAGIVVLVVLSYTAAGWQGVVAVAGGLVMWALLHVTRLMNVMRKASKRPIGTVASAVMLNAKLRKGVNLLHVMAMTQSIGEQLSAQGESPERYRWTDGSQSHVTCSFEHGKLTEWELVRPGTETSTAAVPHTADAP